MVIKKGKHAIKGEKWRKYSSRYDNQEIEKKKYTIWREKVNEMKKEKIEMKRINFLRRFQPISYF